MGPASFLFDVAPRRKSGQDLRAHRKKSQEEKTPSWELGLALLFGSVLPQQSGNGCMPAEISPAHRGAAGIILCMDISAGLEQ